jgi:hypothetical protein
MKGSDDAEITMPDIETPPSTFQYRISLCWPSCRNIRIIKLSPRGAHFPDSLEIELHEFNLDWAPKYDAISYCWGGQHPIFPIICNGQTMEITKNLADALFAVSQDTSEPIWMWADAICINQSDDSEKSVQVELMRDIYRTARMVHVWLGLEAPEGCVEKINSFLDAYLNAAFDQIAQVEDIPRDAPIDDDTINSFIPLKKLVNTYNFDHLIRLYSCPWFSRVWVIQEIALSQNVLLYWGSSRIMWNKLMAFYLGYQALRYLFLPASVQDDPTWTTHTFLVDSFINTCIAFREPVQEMTVLRLLVRHRAASATDPRDKVFGLLGLVTEGMKMSIKVDYSLDVVDVYVNVAISVIEGSKDLDILSVPRPAHTNVTLPSWAPDWSACLHPTSIMKVLISQTPLQMYQASGGSISGHRAKIRNHLLEVQGFTLDIIQEVGPVMDTKSPSRGGAFNALLKHLELMVRIPSLWRYVSRCRSGRYYPNGEDSFEVFLRTIYEDNDDERSRMIRLRGHYRSVQMAEWWCWLLQLFFVHWHRDFYAILVGLGFMCFKVLNLPWTHQWTALYSAEALGMCFARTKQSYIALIPPIAAVDDAVMLVKGSRVPLILRKRDRNWELIGHACVPGLMKGEQWDEKRCKGVSII